MPANGLSLFSTSCDPTFVRKHPAEKVVLGYNWTSNKLQLQQSLLSSGVTVPMSYDHKPCQLKEKKRIQEAGGFVAMNGVWRVMGVLATSRALGDYPLKVI